jgi:TRAP-type mannitol/chloroaromatic compound transport system permease small subunit
MNGLLAIARAIDWLNERVGRGVYWLVLVCVVISAANALARYTLNMSSNAWLEAQWYLFSIIFLAGAAYTLKHNGHVRIDLVSAHLSRRTQAKIDLFGFVFMLLPVCILMIWFGWSAFAKSIAVWEQSPDPGGLPRWPIKIVVPVAFALLALQAVAELIKRVAWMKGLAEWPNPNQQSADAPVGGTDGTGDAR